MDDKVSLMNDELQNTKVAAVDGTSVPRVGLKVRSNKYGSSRNPESLIKSFELGFL